MTTTEQWRENAKLGLDRYFEGDCTEEFDVWLDSVKAAAWKEGRGTGFDDAYGQTWDEEYVKATNPYKPFDPSEFVL